MTASILKPHCWIKTVNPSCTSLLYDPWYGEISLAYKPTYINMNLDLNLLNCSDFCSDNKWDLHRLIDLFGPSVDVIYPRLGQVNPIPQMSGFGLPRPLSIRLHLLIIIF